MRNWGGFLLASVLSVGALLSVVSLDRLPSDKVKVHATTVQMEYFVSAIRMYQRDTKTYPSPSQGLAALWVRPSNVAQWDGPYLKGEIPNDPWGRPYVYKFPGDHGEEPDVSSVGPNGTAGDADDIVSWK